MVDNRLLDGYALWLEAEGRAQATIRNHHYSAGAWARWAADNGLDVLTATRDDLLRWRAGLASVNASSTVRLRMFGLRMFGDYLIDVGLRTDNPARSIRLAKQVARPVQPFSDREVEDMVEAAETMRDRAIILLLADGGLRRDEVVKITRDDVDFDRGTIRIFGKGSKYRTIAPGPRAMAAVRYCLKREHQLCPVSEGDHDYVWRRVKRVAKLAGVEGRVFPHRFRHTFATAFCDGGGGVDQLQVILGHSTLEMSMHYSRHGREQRALSAQTAFNARKVKAGELLPASGRRVATRAKDRRLVRRAALAS